MRLMTHVIRMIVQTAQYAKATRTISLLIVVIVGLALVALAVGAQVVAPLAVYPFA